MGKKNEESERNEQIHFPQGWKTCENLHLLLHRHTHTAQAQNFWQIKFWEKSEFEGHC